MSKVFDIYKAIDAVAPFSTQMDFDNSGLLVGNSESDVRKVLICLDITRAVAEEAVGMGAELIISHHPIIFDPLKALMEGTALYDLVKNEISAICAHTNLDICQTIGVNRALSDALGFVNFRKAEYGDCLYIADLKVTSDVKALGETIGKKLNCRNLIYNDNGKQIKNIAFCSGAGGEFVFDAVRCADAFLTGEAHHHELIFASENKFPIFVAGHYSTERIFAPKLKSYLEKKFGDCSFGVSAAEKDPMI